MVQHSALNDGFIHYGTKETKRSEKGKRIGDAFLPQGILAYQEMSAREEDYQLAQVMSKSLDLKIKTPYPPSLQNIKKSKLTIILNSTEYEVIKCDPDRARNYLYFYLQEVGVFEQG
ncbi:phage head-tail adapter protein [Lysinibacillus yapensis]|uniref:Phage head-tail adapter protein n=1 Tax=Ureibacillus yapensis TaxID=2304605 RepID=A0A396SBK3_9BACL|nr:phage head closure protein [Lysinibacillus yapensis]RHW38704.1 phage head-tail adapter protein [Lysinibacillus yapensis]